MRRHWAGGTDRLLAGRRFTCLFSDLDVPPASVIADAMAELAAAGSHTRLALTPRRDRRIWSADRQCPIAVHELPDSVAQDAPSGVLEYVRRLPGPRRPLTAHTSPRRLVLDLDHGLGDGRFAVDLTSALFAHCRGDSTPWVSQGDTPLALPQALFHVFARHPVQVAAVWRQVARIRSEPAVESGPTVPWSPSYAVTLTRVDAEAERAVNQWCRAHGERPGSAAVWLHLVRQALSTAGIAMTPRAIVAFDCRRYQPDGQTANANFMIGLDIPATLEEPISVLAARLLGLMVSGAPLAGMAVVSAKAMLGLAPDVAAPSVRRIGAPGVVMYSDMGLLTGLEVPWRAGGVRLATGLLDPAGPNAITVLNTRADDTRTLAISFHDNVFDRQVVERAAAALAEPMRILGEPTPSQ
ncbi:hypothetical protein [Mycolicibacterium sp. P9-22]|uniref:hypothetical protein n=1 Tax=Mycolicibacterium sp. P9-22 TaxID=2024613 RepID=UPI0011EE7D33|nr:hypothetical protein [Mycolicibacterium sp. P9-22]